MIFKTIHRGNGNLLNTGRATVLFFHPTCIHCVMMRNEWEKMKEELKRKKKNCNIYEVSGEELAGIQTPLKQHVDGFPTIINIENGKFKESFQDQRILEKMLSFVEKNENQHKINKKRKSVRKKPKTLKKKRAKRNTLRRNKRKN